MVTLEQGEPRRTARIHQRLPKKSANRQEVRPGAPRGAVTAIRLGDVDAPTVAAAPIAVDTLVGPAPLLPLSLHGPARIAHRGAVQLLDSLGRLAGQFRRGELAEADRDFSALIGALRALTRVTAILVEANGTRELRNRLDAVAGRLSCALDAIAASRTDRQWWAMANLLEGQIAQVLDQWTTILAAMYETGRDAGAEETVRGAFAGERVAS